MDLNDFGDPLTFPLGPPRRWHLSFATDIHGEPLIFHLVPLFGQNLAYDQFPWS